MTVSFANYIYSYSETYRDNFFYLIKNKNVKLASNTLLNL